VLGAGGRNDPSIVCTYELKRKISWLGRRVSSSVVECIGSVFDLQNRTQKNKQPKKPKPKSTK
jgi:hypothetical protein